MRRVLFSPDRRRAERACNEFAEGPSRPRDEWLGEEPLVYRVVKVTGGFEVWGYTQAELESEVPPF